MKSRRFVDAAIVLLLAIVVGAVFRKITRLWWMFDDPFHFNILQRVSVLGSLYDKTLYNALGTPLFTPFLMLSLRSDLALFGGNARPFYIHQLRTRMAALRMTISISAVQRIPCIASSSTTTIAAKLSMKASNPLSIPAERSAPCR